jgi:hypothetical protein
LTAAEQHKAALRAAITRLLSAAEPSRFCTLTFVQDVPDAVAHREFRAWARHVARDLYRSHVRIAWAFAPQARNVLHFHALLAPDHEPHVITDDDIRRVWRHGSADVQAVYDADGVADYLVKHVDVTADDIRRAWVVNVACDRRLSCRRRRGCTVAPGPWRVT